MKHPFYFVGVVAAATAILVGCSSSKQQPETKDSEAGRTVALGLIVDREFSVSWDNYGRGGAALRQPAYVHVVGEGQFYGEIEPSDSSSDALVSIPSYLAEQNALLSEALILAKGNDQETSLSNNRRSASAADSARGADPRSFTVYELTRWERFCQDGRGMDERDWMFVDEAGYKNAPMEAFDNCSPPNHGYSDYLKAWERFCDDSNPSALDLKIVRESVRPFSTVNPCSAIQGTQ